MTGPDKIPLWKLAHIIFDTANVIENQLTDVLNESAILDYRGETLKRAQAISEDLYVLHKQLNSIMDARARVRLES